MSKRGLFQIRYKLRNHGRDGGLGPARTFRATLPRGTLSEAQKRMRCDGVIIEITRVKDRGR